MTVLLKGKAVADVLKSQIQAEVKSWKQAGVQPKMVTLLIDGDPASLCYALQKSKIAESLGIAYELKQFPNTVSEETLVQSIEQLNAAIDVHGIMLELPLPVHLSAEKITAVIHPDKDVDGLSQMNQLATLTGQSGLYPATPMACVRLLKHYGYSLSGKHVVLVGCGKTVGMPLMHLLLRENATVTVCHAGTGDLRPYLAQADITFVAVGKRDLITPDMVHSKLLIIDAGINETPDNRIVGDVSPDVVHHVAAMSPTPGGVGAVTTVQLFANLLCAMEKQAQRSLVSSGTQR